MHLLVLSAFRRIERKIDAWLSADVSMHLLVLSAFRRPGYQVGKVSAINLVSMHLLVLSAFRLY